MKIKILTTLYLLSIILLSACSEEIKLPEATEGDRIGFEINKDWQYADNTETRTETATKRKMIEVAAIRGQLPEDTDSLFLQIIEDKMIPEETETPETRSILRPGYYYLTAALSAYRYVQGTWDETQAPNYFNNVRLDLQGQTVTTNYVWPGAKYSLRYFGTAPAGHGTLSSPDKPGYPTLDYTIPSEISKQVSLVTVLSNEYSGDYRQNVDLKFHHVTASVYFKEADGLVPGHIKSISLKNLYGTGTYDFKTDSWTDLRNPTSYTSEINKRVTGMDGEDIQDYLSAFTVLPQQTPAGTTVEVVYTDDYTKEERVLSGNLTCRFEAGKRYDIYITPHSIRCEYSFEYVTNTVSNQTVQVPTIGKGATPLYLNMAFDNSTQDYRNAYAFRLKRTIIQVGKENASENLSLEDDCNLEIYTLNRTNGKYDIPTKLTDTFLSRVATNSYNQERDLFFYDFYVKKPEVAEGAIDAALKEMPERGSEEIPYNLANATGASNVEETANCYIVNAPGVYSIPLVYGNAIKDGQYNTKSLTTGWFTANNDMITPTASVGRKTNSSTTSPSFSEIKVTSPYIADLAYDYMASVKVQWQSPNDNLITDVKMSDDRKFLTFKIDKSTIAQGNALISVMSTYGALWSWHIWVTDYVPGQGDKTLVVDKTKKYTVMPRYLGWVDRREGNDESIVRMVINVKGTKKSFEFYPRIKANLKMYGEGVWYQWGRPMPFLNPNLSIYTLHKSTLSKPLLWNNSHPTVLLTSTQQAAFIYLINIWNWTSTTYTNSSNTTYGEKAAASCLTNLPVKTIYDPCPVGYCMPAGDTFTDLFSRLGTGSSTPANDYQVTESNYSNAIEIYCNPTVKDPEDTYVFPDTERFVYQSSKFVTTANFSLWTCSMERSTTKFALGHAYTRTYGYKTYASPVENLNQIIPMREP